MKLKIFISCIVVMVFCFICYELTYFRMMYEEVQKAYNSTAVLENTVDKLLDYIIEKERIDAYDTESSMDKNNAREVH